MGKEGARFTRNRVVWGAVGALALAGVIFAASALSSPSKSEPPAPSKLSAPIRAEQLARSAQQALSENQTATALAAANQALKLDPQNAAAQQVVNSATTPEPSEPAPSKPATSTNTDTAADAKYLKPVSDLGSLLPASITGWTTGQMVKVKPDALVTFEPKSSTPAAGKVVRVIFNVHDQGSASKAAQFVTRVDKRAYTKNQSAVDVGAVKGAFFGTDGRGVAAVAFARGRYAFELVVAVRPGTTPGTLKQLATQLAGSFPATK